MKEVAILILVFPLYFYAFILYGIAMVAGVLFEDATAIIKHFKPGTNEK